MLGDAAMAVQICSSLQYSVDLAAMVESMVAMVVRCSCFNGGVPFCFAEVWQFPWLFAEDLW